MNRKIRRNLKFLKDYYKIIKLSFVKAQYNGKVFCIGFNKTGTTSLGKSLELLGYNNASFNRIVWNRYYRKNQIDKVLKYTAKFQSLDDLPWLKEDMIPILDKSFPNSKFIYLTRDEESWKKSLYKWSYNRFGEHADIDNGLMEYRAHTKFVLNYFKDRSEKEFITLDIRDPKGFKKLATFLGKTSIGDSFPHFNKSN